MASSLRCIAGPHEGRELTLQVGRPLDMPVRTRGERGGLLRVSAGPEGWIFENESPVASMVNGVEVRRTVLSHGDLLKVGKLTFEVHLDKEEVSAKAGAAPLDVPEHPRGKGDTVVLRVPRTAASATETGTQPLDAEPIREEEVARPASSSGRSRRRISASRPAVRDDAGARRQGLFKRVSQVFRRGGRREDFRELVHLRDRLLRSMGRWAIERQGGLGLPDDFLRRMSAGERVTLARTDLAGGDLEAFRQVRQRLAQLDAEIEALRHELDLPPDGSDEDLLEILAAMAGVEEPGGSAIDGYTTEALPEDIDIEEPAASDVEVAGEGSADHSSAARRRRRRR